MPPGDAPTVQTAQYIIKNKIAIRVGALAEGAAYGLIDTGGEVKEFPKGDFAKAASVELWAKFPANPKFHPTRSTSCTR
ncbi:MAG TPA: hypothetical protein VGX23_15945 [Actinocrinis sp.]|nr:hypothetical protein [Actinocrinis sp.]